MIADSENPGTVLALEVLGAAMIAVAGWLLRQYRREGVQDVAIEKLKKDSARHDEMHPRIQRMELVIGIDPIAGGGLAAQLEQLHLEVQESARERKEQNAELLRELKAVMAAVGDSRRELSERIQALELTTVRR